MLWGDARQRHGKHINIDALELVLRFLADKAHILPEGRHDLEDGIYATIKTYQPAPAAQRRFESHVRYADVQYVTKGGEMILVTPVDRLPVIDDRLADDDVRFHSEPVDGMVREIPMRPGDFLLLSPEDAHKPECLLDSASGRKAIVKIPVDLLFKIRV